MKDDFKTLRQLGWASAILFSIWYVMTEPANTSGIGDSAHTPQKLTHGALQQDTLENPLCDDSYAGSTVSIASKNCFTSTTEL